MLSHDLVRERALRLALVGLGVVSLLVCLYQVTIGVLAVAGYSTIHRLFAERQAAGVPMTLEPAYVAHMVFWPLVFAGLWLLIRQGGSRPLRLGLRLLFVGALILTAFSPLYSLPIVGEAAFIPHLVHAMVIFGFAQTLENASLFGLFHALLVATVAAGALKTAGFVFEHLAMPDFTFIAGSLHVTAMGAFAGLSGVACLRAARNLESKGTCTSLFVHPGHVIQPAIDAAPAGATVELGEGTWNENLVIRKPIVLKGAGSAKTRITGKKKRRPVLTVGAPVLGREPGEVVVEDLRFTQALGSSGIHITHGAENTFIHCVVTDNEQSGVHVVGRAKAKLLNCTITSNKNGGVSLDNSAAVHMSKCIITSNATYGIGLSMGSLADVEGCRICANEHGIRLWDSSVARLRENKICANRAIGVIVSGHTGASAPTLTCQVVGGGNRIPGPGDTDGNGQAAVYPAGLAFLMTKEGGRRDLRE